MSTKLDRFPDDYADWLAGIKQRIVAARQRAAPAVNEIDRAVLADWPRDSGAAALCPVGRQGA